MHSNQSKAHFNGTDLLSVSDLNGRLSRKWTRWSITTDYGLTSKRSTAVRCMSHCSGDERHPWLNLVLLDPRTSDLFLMSSPLPSALICLGYLVVVCIGPAWMKNRPAYNIRHLLIVYNFAMVALSGYLFYEVMHSARCDKHFSRSSSD